MRIDNELKAALQTMLKEKIVVMSWGIYDIRVTESGIRFHVHGFKYAGAVEIWHQENAYHVKIGTKQTRTCQLGNLVGILDHEIETPPSRRHPSCPTLRKS